MNTVRCSAMPWQILLPGFPKSARLMCRTAATSPAKASSAFSLGRDSEESQATLSNDDDDADYVFLAANGEREGSNGYHRLLESGKRCAAYSPLFGSMPLGIGLDLAIAALSIRQGMIYPAPASTFEAPVSLGETESIACVQRWRGGGFSVRLSKPSRSI